MELNIQMHVSPTGLNWFLFESLIIKFGESSILEKWLVSETKVSTYILGRIYSIDVIINIQKMHS